MPVKNAGSYLKPCLDSILAQSYTDWELIAINDGSSDGSDLVLNQYAQVYPNILTANSDGKGVVAALKKAYELSKGELIHRMDADDLMPVNKLKWMEDALSLGSVVTGKVEYFCDEREVGAGFLKYAAWLNGLMDGGDFWRDTYRECPLPSSAWMMHREDFEAIGGFNSELMPEDYDLAFRILKNDLDVVRLDRVVHHWRDSETRVSRNEEQYFPIAYVPLKVHYFLRLHRDRSRKLVLWGAGKKGKLVAKQLIDHDEDFMWVTNNTKKIGKDIYGVLLQPEGTVDYLSSQVLIAISSPDEQTIFQQDLDYKNLKNNEDYFWFF